MSAGACQGPAECECECARRSCLVSSAPALITSTSTGAAPNLTFDSVRFALLRIASELGANPGQKKPHQLSPPPAPARHFTLLCFALHYYHIPTPESTSLAYLVPSTASA